MPRYIHAGGLFFLFAGTCLAGAGCGAPSPDNCTTTILVQPGAATLDHTVSGNSVQFAVVTRFGGVCDNGITPAYSTSPNYAIAYQWSISNAVDASIDQSTGIATCRNAALAPITVTQTPFVGTASLICR